MEYGVTWEPECSDEFFLIYDGDESDAVSASRALEWRLSRDPFRENRQLVPGSGVYVTWLEPFKHHPAVVFSFRVVEEQFRRYCLLEKVRKANVPGLS